MNFIKVDLFLRIMAKDADPDFIGAWSRREREIRNEEDFGAFYLWLTPKKKGFCFDDFGYSDISMKILNSEKVDFLKRYAQDRGGIMSGIRYFGTSGDGQIYYGKWDSGWKGEGEFMMMRDNEEKEFTEFEKFIARCNALALNQKLIETRERFPYSSLQNALKS
ncbi:MAG: hypothetical protein KKC19_00645 [Nanoarchaeota archaeon]|nr:hypothetical protein [Nanoarchaeota archaeon]